MNSAVLCVILSAPFSSECTQSYSCAYECLDFECQSLTTTSRPERQAVPWLRHGRIVHRNGLRWLSTLVSDVQHDRHFSPHRTEPGTKDSGSLISVPSSPFVFFHLTSKAALMFVIASQVPTPAKRRAGHMPVDT